MKSLLIVLFSLTVSSSLFGQLDTIHWLPPMHARIDWGPQYLYLSTPETTPFAVNLRDGSGNLIMTINISNAQPFRYDIGSSNATYTLVPESDLSQGGVYVFYAEVEVLPNKVIILQGDITVLY